MFKKISFALLATTSLLSASDQVNMWDKMSARHACQVFDALKSLPLEEEDIEDMKTGLQDKGFQPSVIEEKWPLLVQEVQKQIYREDILNFKLTSKRNLELVYNFPNLTMNLSKSDDFDSLFLNRTLPLPVHMDGGGSLMKIAQGGRTMANFVKIMTNHKNIQSLTWQDRHYQSGYSSDVEAQQALGTLQTICPSLSQLTSLTLGYDRNLTDPVAQIKAITLGVVSLPNLQQLTMYMRPTAGRVVFENLSRMTKLQSLTLKNEVREIDQKMGPNDALLLKNNMQNNTTLQILDLSINNFGDAGAQHISDMLKDNKGLTKLSLRYNNMTDAGGLQIADSLKTNSTLKSLDLVGNNFMAPATIEAELKQRASLETFSVRADPNAAGNCIVQ